MPDFITLGISEPYTAEQVKALTQQHPRGGYGGVPSYSSWGAWDNSLWGGLYAGSKVNYAERVGDLSASSLIMAGVRWAGSTLPEAPIQVKEGTGKKGDSEVVPSHPLVQLWRRPNPYYSGSTMMKGFAFSWITKGDVYIRKVWNRARTKPVELWYEPHWLIRPRWIGDNRGAYIFGEDDDPNAFINYYEVDREGKKYRLEVSDVIHFRDGINPETRCGHNGIASILREAFGDNEAANTYAALMSNNGIPKFILVADPDVELDEAERKKIEEDANRGTTGDNRSKVLAISGLKPYKLAWSPKDLDLRASRFMSEDRFAAVTGIPTAELEFGSAAEHSIYNNVRQASERATERFLVPTWGHIAEELSVQLLPDFDGDTARYVAHDLSRVRALQEDEDAKHKRVAEDYRNGIIDRAESRSALGYEPRDEDKDVYFPNTGQKAGETVETPPDDTAPPTKSAPAVPSDERIAEFSDWWNASAPEEARGAVNAKVLGNGNGAAK